MLHLEDGSRLSVGEGEMMDYALHSDMELAEDTLEILRQRGQSSALRKKAVPMLSTRPYSRGELMQKLGSPSGEEAEQVEAVCQWAEDIGLLDEGAYAAAIVRHYEKKGYGLYKIRDELYRRKLPKALWEDALGQMEGSEAAIDRYLEAKLRNNTPAELRRVTAALSRRGFSCSDILEGIARMRFPDVDEV